MDAGTSAVLAGAIAALAGLGGNYFVYRQTKRQMISEAQLQLREPRKRTYGDFLLASREAINDLANLRDEETQEADGAAIEHTIDEHRHALQRALAAVSLEGPEVVSNAANKTVSAFYDLHHQAFAWERGGGDSHDDGRPVGFGNHYTHEIREALDHYLKEARKALATSADR
ncbi:hypothetical protein HCC61_11050 [Streptomyces sp. HNM0575]|uniref:hypothetical protein n=1 Tax=Streptomyces sp. HNM0575 TaxID=2716338 RepID=UPI00145EBA4D|nr:hypothetical protein [Streptomyces sp. HNM0575]NLU73210.1 hypothetical protein [Streptomyces sp. HNM0575]